MTGTTTPNGYLGAEAMITSGPAPELVDAGYALEIADAPLLHRGLTLADLAHLLALIDCRVLSEAEVRPLLRRLLDLLDTPAAEFEYDPAYGDAYNSRERVLERELGPDAGRLHLGRTRREAGRIAFRLALREHLLDLHDAVTGFAEALAVAETDAADTLWADTTYLQPAQPSTFGHYLGGFAEQAVRHLDRIADAHRQADVSPGGSGGVGGTRLPLDRNHLAALLGFAAAGRHTRDVMWSTDGLVDAVGAATQAVLTVDQLAEDLEIFASPAFGYVTLDASLCRASVLMPQKRNPYALAVIRGGASTVVGRLTGLLVTRRSPSARTDSWLYAYGEVAGALALSTRLVRLGTAVVRGLTPNTENLAAQAGAHHTGAADLAEDFARHLGLDYRTAYRVVGRAVSMAGEHALTPALLAEAAEQVTGAALVVPDRLVALAAEPRCLVAERVAEGGAAPHRVREHAAAVAGSVAAAREWHQARFEHARDAEQALVASAHAMASGR
ncbi:MULTISPECIES: lyase family protein [Amycolatopsis]|uniref:argininosuccinate lyase n=2 Tax=Amycolatopsis TaxID=1813 RepID=A0A2N3X111_9PSEU|nr:MULTISPECIES: lyase family protein [Amycolatopsis]PKV99800.1 argininosuccinate lyase [Amycolatopsis niigatensis]WIV60791.1 lyase family protein [Amycolatopsis sp. 2-2]